MSDQRAAPGVGFCFKPDDLFKAQLLKATQGNDIAKGIMRILGHEPAPIKPENDSSEIFKDSAMKRDRRSDFYCLRCGMRFEVKTKSDDRLRTGPDLLTGYAAENSRMIFVLRSRILVVRARDLEARRKEARQGRNRYGEPWLDFSDVQGIPVEYEIKRRPQCEALR